MALSAGAALAAGLAGSAHCAAMCGGLAAAVGAGVRATGAPAIRAAAVFNAGRVAGYALVGAALAATVGTLAGSSPLPAVALGARLVAAAVLAALALRLWTGRDLLGAERLGQAFWSRVKPLFAKALVLPEAARPAALGLLWGLMPCGLVYSVLMVAAASGDALAGAATMAAFGIGTLPAMISLTLGGASLGSLLTRPAMRRTASALVLVTAVWTLVAALQHPLGAGHDHAHMHGSPTAGAAWTRPLA